MSTPRRRGAWRSIFWRSGGTIVVVLHEIAHHFGISDEPLIELDRY